MDPAGEQAAPTPTPTSGRRCAVCKTEITDLSLTRCPQCHSRYIRAEGTESKGAAGLSIGVIPTAPPPPPGDRPPRQGTYPPVGADVLPALGMIAGVLALSTAVWIVGMMTLSGFTPGGLARFEPATLVVVIALAVFGGWGVYAFIRSVATKKTSEFRAVWACPHCRYSMMTMHSGRCPECGKLPDPLEWNNYRCPECRRDLHGYHASNCPECGADVRHVTDGPNPEDGRHLPEHVPTPFDRSRVQAQAWSRPEEPDAPPQAPSTGKPASDPQTPPMG